MKAEFPSRLVGDLDLTEAEFRVLLSDVRESRKPQGLVRPPPSFYPRITLTIMTFTARYDYEGAFWPAFARNLGVESVDQRDWGFAYREALKDFKLVRAGGYWMVNVFPVLFHSIIPERSIEDFAAMVKALCEVADIRLLDNEALGEALDSADLPVLLKRFVSGAESRAVAQELVRHSAEDYRLGANLSGDTLRGRLLASMRTASDSRAFVMHVHPLSWRWDFDNGACGVWLSATRSFEKIPLYLHVSGADWDVRSRRTLDRWQLMPQLLTLPLSTGGMRGAITSYGEDLLQVRLGSAPQHPPYIFHSSGNAGLYEPSDSASSGDFAIAMGLTTRIVTAVGEEIECLEGLPVPMLDGAEAAGIYSLDEGAEIFVGDQRVFTVRRATRPSVELRSRTSWFVTGAQGETPAYRDPPRLEVRSPLADSAFLLFEDANTDPVSVIPFVDRLQVQPHVRSGLRYRASVSVAGRSAGTSGTDFMVLPIFSEVAEYGSRLYLSISGDGLLTVNERKVTLQQEKPLRVSFGQLQASEQMVYDFGGHIYTLRYAGRRPTLWGFERSSLDDAVLTIRVDRLATTPQLVVSGMPGSAVALEIGGVRFATATLGTDGRAALSLENCIPIARGREALEVTLIDGASARPAFTVFSVPQIGYDSIAVSRHGVFGDLRLDAPVDQLNLIADAFHAPWIPSVVVPCEGLGQSWQIAWTIDAQLPTGHWEISFTGEVDGDRVRIFRDGMPWARHFNAAADRRTAFDEKLYNLLDGHDSDVSELNQGDLVEAIRRGLAMLSLDVLRKERLNIEELFRGCAAGLLIRDIAPVEAIFTTLSHAKQLRCIAASCQLPLAAFVELPFDVPQVNAEPSARKIFRTFSGMAAPPAGSPSDAAFAEVIAGLESDTHPLIAAYARLLRQLLAPETGTSGRLEELLLSRPVSEAILDVGRFGGTYRWTGNVSFGSSLFAAIVGRIWSLATIARGAGGLEQLEAIPLAVRLISPMIFDENVGDLTSIALSWSGEIPHIHSPARSTSK